MEQLQLVLKEQLYVFKLELYKLNLTTTAQDGTFSLTVDSGTTGVLRGEGGFDPVTNLQFGEGDSLASGSTCY